MSTQREYEGAGGDSLHPPGKPVSPDEQLRRLVRELAEARGQNDALRALIDKAPHGDPCDFHRCACGEPMYLIHAHAHQPMPCDCWKSEVAR